jgi:AcrR family transcriptional regulator
MVRDADQTKRRLLDAAAAEFTAVGIAGARVDRIAEAAGSNKAMIYAYFGNKDQLFDAVFTDRVASFIDEVDFDATDLPGYAGRLFDSFEDSPETLRLSTWYQLERPQGEPLQTVAAGNERKLSGIDKAQEDGILPRHYSAVELLSLVRSIASAWASLSHSSLGDHVPADRAVRRNTVVDAVQRIIADASPASDAVRRPQSPSRPRNPRM